VAVGIDTTLLVRAATELVPAFSGVEVVSAKPTVYG
jgi:hypothetical protein